VTRRIALLANPRAGKGRGRALGAAAAAALRKAGHEVVDVSAPTADAARERARAAIESGVDALAVCGGDGMVHLGAGLCAGTALPLGIVAAGTGNDVATALGLPVHDAAAAARVIAGGHVRSIDAGRAVGADGTTRWWVGVLGAGFDSLVNERANRWVRPRGRLRYTLAVARELPVFRPVPFVLELDGGRRETPAMLVAVGNGPSYGGGMRVCPDADPADGLLDVAVVHALSTPAFLRVFPRVFAGTHVRHPAVEVVRARRVRLEAPGIVAFADGERVGPLPLDCEVVPGALRVLTTP
jgi:diacylglycerol kinase (ATP)